LRRALDGLLCGDCRIMGGLLDGIGCHGCESRIGW
jgi:hypothetical protein